MHFACAYTDMCKLTMCYNVTFIERVTTDF